MRPWLTVAQRLSLAALAVSAALATALALHQHQVASTSGAVLIAIGAVALAILIVAPAPTRWNFGQREPRTWEANQARRRQRKPHPEPEHRRRSRTERDEQLWKLAEDRDAKLAQLEEELLGPYRQAPPRRRRDWRGAYETFNRDFEAESRFIWRDYHDEVKEIDHHGSARCSYASLLLGRCVRPAGHTASHSYTPPGES